MKVWNAKMLAVSLAGHDKGGLYVVVEDDGLYCQLCDGRRKLLDSPKKKKFMHLQVIRKIPEELRPLMEGIIRRILKEYRRYLCQKQML